jgi:Transposase
MIFVGVAWAEAHHEVCVLDPTGVVLGRRRVPDGIAGIAQLHGLVADHASEPAQVVVGIELDRGLLVGALVAAGYQVVAVNPLAASRYRERHGTRGPSRTGELPRCWLIWSAPTRLSRSPWNLGGGPEWNLGGGPELIRRHPPWRV